MAFNNATAIWFIFRHPLRPSPSSPDPSSYLWLIMSAITSSANGTYTDCGLGQGVGLAITCGGSSCGILAQFPHLTCTHDPTTLSLNCNNGVVCPPGSSNFQSLFAMQQHPDNSVSVQQQLQIDAQSFQGTDDGHGNIAYAAMMNANPAPSSQVPSNPAPSNSATSSPAPQNSHPAAGTSTLVVVPGTSTALSAGSATGGGTTSTTNASPIPTFASLAPSRRPPISKVLFILFVIVSTFIGQSTATSSFHRVKSNTLTTGMSLLWLLVLAPVRSYAQCQTVAVFPVFLFPIGLIL